MSRQNFRPAPLALAIALALVGTVVHAQDTGSGSPGATTQFAIKAQPLAEALNEWARQTRIQLIVQQGLVDGKTAPAVSGALTPNQALDRLLAGSGLTATREGHAVVIKTAPPAGDAATLAPVVVTAQAERSGATEGTGSYVSPAALSTATPLGLTLKETPQSVSVVTKQRMEDQGLTTINQVLAQVPGIVLSSLGTERGGAEARGYSIANYQLDGVNTHVAGSGLGESSPLTRLDMANYDRIEVLRGASGLMTGAGDPSGTVNLVRKKPTEEFQGAVEGGLGSWGDKRGMLDLSGPLNTERSLRGRFVAAWQNADSYIDNYSRDTKSLYGVLEADLTSTTRLTAGFEHLRSQSKGAFAYLGFPLWYSNGEQADFPRSFSAASRDNSFETKSNNVFVTLEQALGDGWSFKAAASRVRSSQRERSVYLDVSGSFADAQTGDGLRLATGYREPELRIDSIDVNVRGPLTLFGRRHELVFGADYSYYDSVTLGSLEVSGLDYTPANLFGWDRTGLAVAGGPFVRFDGKRRQTSLYAAGRFALSDRLKLIAGSKVLRYDARDVTDNPTYNYYSAQLASENSVWTPYGGLVWDIDGTHTAYASYSSIYKPQTAQDRNGKLIDPREGANYEAGIKSGWLGGRLNTAVALYQIRQDNLTETDPGYFIPGTTNPASRAIRGAKTQGIDVEGYGSLSRQWNVSASWTYAHTEDAKGEGIRTTFPRHLVKLWTTYRLPGDWSRLTVGGGVNWQNKTYSTVSAWQVGRDLYWEQKAFAVVNLMARYEFSDRLSATLNINNLLDKKYISSVSDWWYSGMYGAPRSVALAVKYKF